MFSLPHILMQELNHGALENKFRSSTCKTTAAILVDILHISFIREINTGMSFEGLKKHAMRFRNFTENIPL